MSIMNAHTRSGGAGTVMRCSISMLLRSDLSIRSGSPVYTVCTMNIGPRLRAFLEEPLPIVLGTTRRDGSIQMTPLWFEYRQDQIWLNGGPRRDWFKHLKRDPRATLALVDARNMFRWVQIQGRLADSTFEGADDHIDHLSQEHTSELQSHSFISYAVF